jgi:hypothetical protein
MLRQRRPTPDHSPLFCMETMVRTQRVLLFCVLSALAAQCQAVAAPGMRPEDKIRIREAMKMSGLVGERLWAGITTTPFAIILVTDSVEFLVNHPTPSEDFTLLGRDSVLHSPLYYRKRVFDKHLLATFPAVNGENTIVVGTPENTGRNSVGWIITLLHEHFHQYVYSSPGYYDEVAGLDLSRGDGTGMWMLNYPFPYTDSVVVHQYRIYARAVERAVSAGDSSEFRIARDAWASERRKFQQVLETGDYRYFSFQMWQEGVARYTEDKFLELLQGYVPSKELRDLPDFSSFEAYREQFRAEQLGRIATWGLVDHRRECFYALGLGEGLILDRANRDWRRQYLARKFFLERYWDGE